MASSDKELEQQLMEAGTKLVNPPSSVDELLPLLDDVFQLIVSSFENLADKSSRSYGKRTLILETVAKVRSCVVMLDLECDALIIEMFQHFLNAIRDDHSENIFSSMETIMTLVLEESEDISLELLSPLLASVKRGNEEVLSVACKLGEKVLESCATKVKPYLQHAVKSLGISLEDYSEIVASICQSGTVEQNDAHAADENKVEQSKPAGVSSDEDDKDIAAEAGSPKQADPINDKSPKSIVSNGIAQTGEDDSLADSCSLKKQDDGNHADKSKSIDMSNNTETEKAVNEESKPAQATKKRGRKLNSSTKLTEPSEKVPGSPHEEPSVEAAVSSENRKEAGSSQPSSPKALEGESMTAASPSGSGSLLDESLSKKAGRSKKKESLIKESEPSADDVPRKASEGASDSEAKLNKRSARRAHARVSNEEKAPMATDASKKESRTTSESEAKPLKQSSKKVDASSNNGDESSLIQSQDKKHHSRGKSITEKIVIKSSTKDDNMEKVSSPKSATKLPKDEHQLEETPNVNSKRKRASGNEKASRTREYNASLVDLRVKVWWPIDQTFYEGVIRSYDPVKKKHEVAYDDGDTEVLNLKRQKWEIVGEESAPNEGEASDPETSDVPSEMPPKKKTKTNTDQSTKQGKVDASPLSKSKNDDITPSKTGKSKEEEMRTPKASKSKQETVKSGKSKQDTPKISSNAKGKSPKSGGKSSVNVTEKLKSGSSKVKEVDDNKENPTDSGKPQESVKGKSLSSTKGQGSEVKSGKKRRRV
ncbi:hypothetical protein GH714_008758 [Hevea brasiliensis]|uniref:Tudor domain-containing protein n=1 Tax=Hevea brasiliensis TaxID=3981 RepID=A0A6A6MKK1_HEVBR|nr:hypothetical protein GH714_008758 [Hevea brasiliensis]